MIRWLGRVLRLRVWTNFSFETDLWEFSGLRILSSVSLVVIRYYEYSIILLRGL
jgi:hypothetical protein